MRETPFQNPRGGYFTMNDRGRLVAERQHNPNNVHIGERYYGRQGPIGNPRLASGGYYSHSPYDEYPHEDFHVIEPWMGYGSDQAYPIGSTGSDWDFNYNDRRRDYEDRVFGPLYIG